MCVVVYLNNLISLPFYQLGRACMVIDCSLSRVRHGFRARVLSPPMGEIGCYNYPPLSPFPARLMWSTPRGWGWGCSSVHEGIVICESTRW